MNWKKLFGGSEPAPPATETEEALIPGRLSARIIPHDLPRAGGTVPCWTYVTRGLAEVGQKELILTLRRLDGERAAPDDPLRFFAQVHHLASQGRTVGAGAYTAFRNPTGFLGETGTVGFAYTTPEAYPGVELPPRDQALLAVLLTGEEAEAVQVVGTYRVLSLLGRSERYYPCPPWSVRQRPSVMTRADLEASLLSKLPSGYLGGATVRSPLRDAPAVPAGEDGAGTAGGELLFRVSDGHLPTLRAGLASVPEEGGGLAFLTDPDPEADVRLVWRPGQQAVETITPGAGEGSHLTGGFLALFVGQPFHDGGQIFEDGFALKLSLPTWRRVKAAIEAGQPVQVRAAEPGHFDFRLEWQGPPAKPRDPAAPPGAFAVEKLMLYQPDEVLRARIADFDSWCGYLNRVTASAEDYWAGMEPRGGQSVTLVVAVKPGGRARFWIDLAPGGLPVGLEQGLLQRLAALPVPVVRGGPVAVAVHARLWGGGGGWEFIPRAWRAALPDREAIVPDGVLDVLWPD